MMQGSLKTAAQDDRVGDLAMHHPQACRVFERHRIDYCCGGKRSLAEACRKAGVPVERVLDELASAPLGSASRVWGTESFETLVEHIVANGYLNGETIRLDGAIRMAPK